MGRITTTFPTNTATSNGTPTIQRGSGAIHLVPDPNNPAVTALPSLQPPASVINAQGQVYGRVVNTAGLSTSILDSQVVANLREMYPQLGTTVLQQAITDYVISTHLAGCRDLKTSFGVAAIVDNLEVRSAHPALHQWLDTNNIANGGVAFQPNPTSPAPANYPYPDLFNPRSSLNNPGSLANQLSHLDQLIVARSLFPATITPPPPGGYNFHDPAGGRGPSTSPSRPGPGPAPMNLSTAPMSTPHAGGFTVISPTGYSSRGPHALEGGGATSPAASVSPANSTPNTGNNPGNPNASGYYGGGNSSSGASGQYHSTSHYASIGKGGMVTGLSVVVQTRTLRATA